MSDIPWPQDVQRFETASELVAIRDPGTKQERAKARLVVKAMLVAYYQHSLYLSNRWADFCSVDARLCAVSS